MKIYKLINAEFSALWMFYNPSNTCTFCCFECKGHTEDLYAMGENWWIFGYKILIYFKLTMLNHHVPPTFINSFGTLLNIS